MGVINLCLLVFGSKKLVKNRESKDEWETLSQASPELAEVLAETLVAHDFVGGRIRIA